MRRLQHLPTPIYIAVALMTAFGLVAFSVSDVGAGEETVEIHRTARADHEGLPGGPIFIAIIGTDDRPGVSGVRADAVHVVGINPGQRSATMIDIPRDTYVNIPGSGQSKINNASAFGGAELVGQTLQAFTGAPIQYVITTNFEGFVNLVNEMGGVNTEVPLSVNDSASGAQFPAGKHLVSGEAALAFARARKGVPGGDFGRTWNQGLLLMGALERVHQEKGNPATTMRLAATLMRHLRLTSGTSIVDLYKLGRLARQIDPGNVAHFVMPGTTGSAGGASVVFPTGRAGPLFADFADDAVVQDPSLGDTGPRL